MPPISNSTISAASLTSAPKILSPCLPGALNAGFVAAIEVSVFRSYQGGMSRPLGLTGLQSGQGRSITDKALYQNCL